MGTWVGGLDVPDALDQTGLRRGQEPRSEQSRTDAGREQRAAVVRAERLATPRVVTDDPVHHGAVPVVRCFLDLGDALVSGLTASGEKVELVAGHRYLPQ